MLVERSYITLPLLLFLSIVNIAHTLACYRYTTYLITESNVKLSFVCFDNSTQQHTTPKHINMIKDTNIYEQNGITNSGSIHINTIKSFLCHTFAESH